MASFRNIYTALLLVLAKATNKELARYVSFLKAENQILRQRLPARLNLTAKEKNRLVRFGKNLGSALNHLCTIVHPNTLRKWIRESNKTGKKKAKAKTAGRQRTAADIEKIVLKLANENGWGYTRILGEMRKIGVASITRNTVKAILKRNGFDVGPNRGPGTWDEFVTRHAKTLWQCDFFSKKIVSKTGLRDIFVLIFIHVETRRVFVSPSTYQPNEAWMVEQAKAFIEHTKHEKIPCEILMLDNDSKYSKPYIEQLKAAKVKPQRTAIRSPNMVAFAERFVQTIKQECLDHFIVFGHKHMDVLCKEFETHYLEERPHQGLNNDLIGTIKSNVLESAPESEEPATISLDDIRCKERLGGLLKSYSRKAA